MIFKDHLLADVKVEFNYKTPTGEHHSSPDVVSKEDQIFTATPSTDDDDDIPSDSESGSDTHEEVYWQLDSQETSEEEEDSKGSFHRKRLLRSNHLKKILDRIKNIPQRSQSLDTADWAKKCLSQTVSHSLPQLNTEDKDRGNSPTVVYKQTFKTSAPNLSDDSAIRSSSTTPEVPSVGDRMLPKRVSLLSRRQQQNSEPIIKHVMNVIHQTGLQPGGATVRHTVSPQPGLKQTNQTSREQISRQLQSTNDKSLRKYTGDGSNLVNKYEFMYMSNNETSDSDSDSNMSDESEVDSKCFSTTRELNLLITAHDKTKALTSLPALNNNDPEYFVSPESNVLIRAELDTKISHSNWVDFSDMRLLSLPPSLTSHEHVQALKLDGNWIQKLPDDINLLDNLQCISIRGNYLYNVPENLDKCEHLQWLNLEDNSLTTLPGHVTHLQQLSYLNVKKNSLENFPHVITTLQNLAVLDLSENTHLKLKPGYLKHLKHLTWLSLAATVTLAIPTDIDQCTKLQHLDISRNILRRLPPSIKNLTNLRYINLSKNSFGIFPEVLCAITSLEVLDVSFNQLTRVPDSITKLCKLRNLNLENNSFRRIPPYLTTMTSLTELQTAGNGLTH